ncbi:MAG: 5-methyltetrahydropteroyltriglutamate--homocysteine S-methyltransferase [Limnobacter sp.]|nr:5-methyltetrahydropteroyltriglutamate--homocysteine S-methyltransferase [Limnobacter sp.]
MIKSHILGFPRVGEQRELKFELERFWSGESTQEQLLNTGKTLRQKHWQAQVDSGLDWVSVGDFSFYDLMADHIQLLGCEPARFNFQEGQGQLERYFRMVRGQSNSGAHSSCHLSHGTRHESSSSFALEMTKWFDTNYHYMVPEFNTKTQFSAHPQNLIAQINEAQALSLPVKVSLIGPLTFLYLGKFKQDWKNTELDPHAKPYPALDLLDNLLNTYSQILHDIHQQGVEWVQMDEPILSLDLSPQWLAALDKTYSFLKASGPKILLATYFGSTQGQTSQICKLPVDGLHVDCVRAVEDLPLILDWLPNYKVLSMGVVDGRNIWKTNLDKALQRVHSAFAAGKGKEQGQVWLSSSCSLLHSPYSFASDQVVNPQVRPWLAGALEKLAEINLLKQALQADLQGLERPLKVKNALHAQSNILENRANSPLLNNAQVAQRLGSLKGSDSMRALPFQARQAQQKKRFHLPIFPTTTIGSFPQTKAIRALRSAFKKGQLSRVDYWTAIKAEISAVIDFQEEIGIDVLVHGEAERNDMVEYFGEQLEGFTFSANGWVQSYGSRCVKPPILFGDVCRPTPMTVEVASYAQSLSPKPVKGMLTGPVTILQWSFVRDDQPRATTALQIALAIRDEVCDLEAAGIGMIQIDEPAYREGLPLRKAQWGQYLEWASRAFRISASGVRSDTQIHTHMCYSEFNDILPAIAGMDADVITIETSRSDMELLRGFGEFKYPNEIGPGVYDIHSPRVPRLNEMVRLIRKANEVIPAENLWVNPDCGLKTRDWPETEAALKLMVQAAKQLRQEATGRTGVNSIVKVLS